MSSKVKWVASAAIAVLASAMTANAAEFDATNLAVRDITADVRIETNSSDRIEVTIAQGNEHQPIRVIYDEKASRVILQGEGWNDPEGGCCDGRITRNVNIARDRTAPEAPNEAFAKYPVINISMPRSGDVDFDDVRMLLALGDVDGTVTMDACFVYGEAGNMDEAAIGIVSGSRLVVGNVATNLEVDLSGDANILFGDASAVDVDVSGSGEAIFGSIDGMLDVSIAGSGLVRAARHEGPLTTRIAGSGAVAVQSGRADPLKAIIEGSGAVYFYGAVAGTDLRLSRSAEARLGSVRGRINRSGSGRVYVGDELVGENR